LKPHHNDGIDEWTDLRIDEFIVTLDHVVLLGGSPAAAS